MSQISNYSKGGVIPPGTYIETLTGNTGGAVSPTSGGDIQILGSGNILVTGTPLTNTLTATLDGIIGLSHGGTAVDGTAYVDNGTFYFDGLEFATTNPGTLGQVLTSNGPLFAPTYQNASGGGIGTIDGDTGSATGPTVTFNGLPQAGSSVNFSASGSTVLLNVTDVNNNTIIGLGAGNSSISGANSTGVGFQVLASETSGGNTAFGSQSLTSVTSSNWNCGFGGGTLQSLVSGTGCIAIGVNAGANYTGSESYNICVGAFASGTVSENNTLRIGSGTGTGGGNLNQAFISGINGVTSSNPMMVTIDSTTDQLGVASIPSGGSITIDGDSGSAAGSTITFNANSNAGSTVSFSATASTVSLNTTDSNGNVIIGAGSGNLTISGTANAGVGNNVLSALTSGSGNFAAAQGALQSCTSGSFNNAFSNIAGNRLTSGSYNQLLGFAAGYQYTSSESSNILIGHDVEGTTGESNTLRIGKSTGSGAGQLSSAYIAGINGNTITSPLMVTIDPSTDQLGTQAIPSGGSITIDGDTGSITGNPVTLTGGTTGLTFTGASTTMTLDGTLVVANGGTGANSFNTDGVVISGATSTTALTALSLADGEIVIGSSLGAPLAATITPGSGISVTNGNNSITIAATGFTWTKITADQTAAVNNGYICNKASTLNLTLPASCPIGSIIEVIGMNTALGWKIAQNAGQSIIFGTSATTTGVTGYLESSNIFDAVRIVCITADTEWAVLSSVGNITVV